MEADGSSNGRRDATPAAFDRRRESYRRGHGAEWIAVLLLRCKGYRILARRYVVRGGEIDIVASRGDTIAFVEVKHRAALEDALTAIQPWKRRRISRAARAFLARHRVRGLTVRADAVYCSPWRWPLHVKTAFPLDID